ncbi:MAG: esterase [Clostridia bacterium]|nr:esterase [Clostridia bacterium]
MNKRIFGNPDAEVVLLQMVEGDADQVSYEDEAEEIRKLTDVPFSMITMEVDSWNDDLSPWAAPAVHGVEGFGGRAECTLQNVLDTLRDDRQYILGGYSLSGLFALWSACRTDAFAGVAAASPSVWFPDFMPYLHEHKMQSPHVYLSLGDREEKTRNPVLAPVGDCIRTACDLFRQDGVHCTLEWNEGNHFRDAGLRTAKAFAWVLNALKEEQEAKGRQVTQE